LVLSWWAESVLTCFLGVLQSVVLYRLFRFLVPLKEVFYWLSAFLRMFLTVSEAMLLLLGRLASEVRLWTNIIIMKSSWASKIESNYILPTNILFYQ
jgi:hypothetical protein